MQKLLHISNFRVNSICISRVKFAAKHNDQTQRIDYKYRPCSNKILFHLQNLLSHTHICIHIWNFLKEFCDRVIRKRASNSLIALYEILLYLPWNRSGMVGLLYVVFYVGERSNGEFSLHQAALEQSRSTA